MLIIQYVKKKLINNKIGQKIIVNYLYRKLLQYVNCITVLLKKAIMSNVII